MAPQSPPVKRSSDPPPATTAEQPDLMFAPFFGYVSRSGWQPTEPADPRDREHTLAYFRHRGQRPEWADRADDGRPVTRADLRRAAEERARRQARAEAIQAATLHALLARIAALEGRQRQKGVA